MGQIASRELIDNPDGTQSERFRDIETGQVLVDPKDHYVYDAKDLEAMGVTKPVPLYGGIVPIVNKKALNDLKTHGPPTDENGQPRFVPRMPTNNYGYKEVPATLKAAGYVPGVIGLAAKGAGLAMNSNNVAATNSARKTLGLKENGFQSLKGVISDQGGHVADIQMGKNGSVPVSIGSALENGRTTMTPDEARRRMAAVPGYVESTKKEISASKKAVKETYGQRGGILGWALDKVGSPLANHPASDDPSKDVEDAHTAYEKEQARAQKEAQRISKVRESTNTPNTDYSVPDTGGPGWASKDNRVTLSNVDKTRNQQISDATRNQLNYAAHKVSEETGKAITIDVVSGGQISNHDPSKKGIKGGWTGSHRHDDGGAADFNVYADGKKVSFDTPEGKSIFSGIGKYSTAAGATGIGAGVDYMGSSEMHAGGGKLANWGGADWVDDAQRAGMEYAPNSDYKSWASKYANDRVPTPEARPSFIPSINPADEYAGTTDSRVSFMPSPSQAAPTVASNWASKFDDNTKSLMSKTLAGEIDRSRTDLSTEAGRKEAYGILSTMANRSAKYGGDVSKAIMAPKQYSTWNDEGKIATMNANYNKDPTTYDGLTASFLSDPKNLAAYTNYHSVDVNPDWSGKMQNAEQIGPHKFGSLDEYGNQSDVSQDDSPPAYMKPMVSKDYESPAKRSPSLSTRDIYGGRGAVGASAIANNGGRITATKDGGVDYTNKAGVTTHTDSYGNNSSSWGGKSSSSSNRGFAPR